MNEQYISPYKIKKQYDISSNTLRQWSESGLLECIRTKEGAGKRLYKLSDVNRMLGNSNKTKQRISICYARVSSDYQKEDLNRQVELFEKTCPGLEIIRDIGSGINYKRKGFQKLLERISNNEIEQVYVTYKDRLCRFGFELIEWIFKKFNTELKILNDFSSSQESQESQRNEAIELSEDLLSITTVFVARNNGLRSGKYKRERKMQELKELEKEKEGLEE